MSLLIKALDKAQAEKMKAEGANVKQERNASKKEKKSTKRNKKSKTNKEKTSKVVQAEINDVSDLSLSPAKENLISEQEKTAKPKEVVAEQKQRRAAWSLMVEPVEQSAERLAATQHAQHAKQAIKAQPSTLASKSSVSTSSMAAASTLSLPTPIQAANVFAAKQSQETNANATLLLIAAAGLIAIIAMGIYYYQFIDSAPEAIVPQRQIAIKTTPAVLPEIAQGPLVAESILAEVEEQDLEVNNVATSAVENSGFVEQKVGDVDLLPPIDRKRADVERSLGQNEVLANVSALDDAMFVQTKKIVVSESTSIQVTKNQQKPSTNPILMRAYSAYQAGNHDEARRSYKAVLRADGLNIDAMLGLGAIATREGRVADAEDWYRRVLRLEPRNDIARTALLYAQTQSRPQLGDESQIKSMLAKSPNNASLYAALGDIYFEQNQWPAAQQAYFDAYSLNGSADSAYNLAISLDQMGKPKLALPYYQLALEKSEQSKTTAIDKAALQARIVSIQ